MNGRRDAERADVVERVRVWAAGRPDVVGLLLVGSYARAAARPDSDVDLVLLTRDEERYSDHARTDELALGRPARLRSWGAVTEHRFVTASGLQVELNIGVPDWAGTHPVDPGTRHVVSDGARILYDPHELLTRLLDACR